MPSADGTGAAFGAFFLAGFEVPAAAFFAMSKLHCWVQKNLRVVFIAQAALAPPRCCAGFFGAAMILLGGGLFALRLGHALRTSRSHRSEKKPIARSNISVRSTLGFCSSSSKKLVLPTAYLPTVDGLYPVASP